MSTLTSVVSTAHQVTPPSCVLPMSLVSPKATRMRHFHSQGLAHPHRSSCFELLFLEEGEGWHQIGHQEVWVRPGDLFLFAPNEAHNYSGPEVTRSWTIVFEADALAPDRTSADVASKFLDELLFLSFLAPKGTEIGHFQIPPVDRPRWLVWLQQLERELEDKPFGFAEAACTLLQLLLNDTSRLAASQLSECSLQSHPLLASVFLFIESHYRIPISLCDVAKAVNRSPAYLTDFVRRETGRTVLGWIIERRLREARRLLLITNLSVVRISEMVGYFDTGHFIRQFRRLHNMTPRVWRNAQQCSLDKSLLQKTPKDG